MIRSFAISASLALFVLLAHGAVRADDAGSTYEFGTVRQGTPVEHEFHLHNEGAQPLRISGVQITPPMQLTRMPAVIAPGSDAALKVTLDTKVINGEYQGQLLVALGADSTPRQYALIGKVEPALEVLPLPAVFLSTEKGTEKSASVELVNHEDAPIRLSLPASKASVYSARLETIDPGRRFRLTVTVPATAPAGRTSQRIELASSSPGTPMMPIGVNVNVHERVYTFPDAVDFGSLGAKEVQGADPAALAQTVMVYQPGGRDFTVEAKSDVPGLTLTVEPGPDRDRAQITLSLAKTRPPGPISGKLRIHTNDHEFPELTVPIGGSISE